jgi:hypothetical protein
MTRVSAADVLHRPVRLRGIQLGKPVDVILDATCRRALGFEVRCGDDERRFLPLSVATVGGRDVQVSSPLVLLDESQLSFYTRRGFTFRALRGTDVVDRGVVAGRLHDFMFDRDGTIASVTVETSSGIEELEYGSSVALSPPRRGIRAAS